MEAIFLGASQSRNPNLASVFYRLNLIESYGTGIRKIIRLYKDFSKQSVFQSAEGVFSVTLTNQNDNLSESKNSPNTQNKMIDSKI